METQATPEFIIGQMRVQTLCEQPFFYVVSRPTTMSGLDEELDLLIPKLEAAQAEAQVGDGAPVIVRYFPTDTPDAYLMEIGIPVKAGTPAAGEAKVTTLLPYRCASLLYWGSLEHIGQAYETLMQAMREAGLKHTGEGREWHYHFEGDVSPNNVIGLHMAIR